MDDEPSNLLLRALGQRIRELRTEQGYSQEAFADKCGVHRTFMGTVERGESNLSLQNIAKVVATLGVSLSALFRDFEGKAKILKRQSDGTAAIKPKKRGTVKQTFGPRVRNWRSDLDGAPLVREVTKRTLTREWRP